MNYQPPAHTGLTLIYIDEHLLVLDKPAGLLAVPGRGADKRDCLASRVQAEYPEALVVHRLDMATSGLMLMARSEATQKQLSRMFAERQVDKTYIAIVDGRLDQDSGDIDLPLITDWPNRPKQKIDHDIGKPALTHYRVLAYTPAQDTSRVELKPHTGRTHQLRLHMQALGHPILGDPLYAPDAVHRRSPRLLLHAAGLHFRHPANGLPLNLQSDMPSLDFSNTQTRPGY